MANEFIIKNGFHSKGDSQVTGSFNVTNGISGSFSGSFQGDGSGLTGIDTGSAFPFTGDAEITGSLLISGSAISGLTIEGPIQVNHSGSPSAVFTSNSDTTEQVLIYDSKITIEDQNQQLATLSANEYGSRNGILKLSNWTSGIVGASLTAGPYRNFLVGQLVIGKAFSANNTVHGYTLDVTGSAMITGSLTISGSLLNTGTVSYDHTLSPYTLTGTQQFILIDPSGGDVTINMPDAATYPGREIKLKLTENSNANTVTLQCQGADTIDGAASNTTALDTQYEAISVVSDGGTNWFIF